MARTYQLHRRQWIRRPLQDVFAFFADAGNLEAITPPFLQFQILTPLPIAMRAGAVIEYRLKLFGLPFHWRTVIESFDPPHRFIDQQARGPYRLWRHLHEFRETPDGTEMVDRVDYELPLGPIGSLVHAAFVRRSLAEIFDYRQQRIAELLPDLVTARV